MQSHSRHQSPTPAWTNHVCAMITLYLALLASSCVMDYGVRYGSAPPLTAAWNGRDVTSSYGTSPLYLYVAVGENRKNHAHALCVASEALASASPRYRGRIDVAQVVFLFDHSSAVAELDCDAFVQRLRGAGALWHSLAFCAGGSARDVRNELGNPPNRNQAHLVVSTRSPRDFMEMRRLAEAHGGLPDARSVQRFCTGRFTTTDVGQYTVAEALDVYQGLIEKLMLVPTGNRDALLPESRIAHVLRLLDAKIDRVIFRRSP